jgi:large conductance mechanosensitive channel
MLSGFREFIMRGNIVDLAVAFVIGTAFVAVVTSFVTHILTPLLGIFGVPNLEQLSFAVGPAEVRYGLFLNALISFVLIAAAIYFLVVVPLNRIKGPAAVETKACAECTSDIPLGAGRCPMCTAPQPAA